jgi:hypothetical protein
LLPFFVLAALVEPYKERLVQLFKKNTWKTARTFFYIWMGILVLKKLLYYIPFNGIIQTPASVWWVDKEILKPMYTFFIAFLLAAIGTQFAIKYRRKLSKQRDFCFEMAFICWTISVIVFAVMRLTSDTLSWIHIIFSPLLALKMFCTGKYLGLFVSLGLVYFFLFLYRKLISEIINRCAAKFLVGALLIIIGFGFFFYYQLSGDWDKRFQHKVQAAKSEKAFEDLLDAGHSIKDNIDKSNTLKVLALKIAERGNIPWAASVAQSIPDEEIKNTTLKQIREKTEEQ